MERAEKSQTRLYGIDLVKILSMFLVVCAHIYTQGGVLAGEVYGTAGYYESAFVCTLVLCTVDCFVIVNGYLTCKSKSKLSRIIELWMSVVFWSVVVSCFVMAIQPEKRTVGEAVSMFLPILRGRYWFFNAYFIMCCFQPILNRVIEVMEEAELRLALLILVCVFGFIPVLSLGNDVLKFSGGASFGWFLVLYLIGGYLRKYGDRLNYANRWNLIGLFGLAILNIIYKLLIEHVSGMVFGVPKYGDLFQFNASPIILGEAIFLFLFFSRLNISDTSKMSKGISMISSLVFSVYIIHVHPIVFWNSHVVGKFAPLAALNPLLTVAAVCGIAAVVFVVCVALDAVRQQLFALLRVKYICSKMEEKLTRCFVKTLRI